MTQGIISRQTTMAKTQYLDPIAYMTGRISKKGRKPVISRHKIYRDENGNIIAEGPNEAYVLKRPRNYEKKPMKSGEIKTIESFRQAVEQYNADKRDPERMAYWKNRFKAQLHVGDSEAPIDPQTGEHRIYARLDMFIRAILQRQFRHNA